jgi:hypothetical protein
MGRLSADGMGRGTVLAMTWFMAWFTCKQEAQQQRRQLYSSGFQPCTENMFSWGSGYLVPSQGVVLGLNGIEGPVPTDFLANSNTTVPLCFPVHFRAGSTAHAAAQHLG